MTTLRHVPVFEAKNRLSGLLADVAAGAEIVITNRGVPVAKLVGIGPNFDRAAARQAAAHLLEASKGARLDGLSIRDLIEEGRD